MAPRFTFDEMTGLSVGDCGFAKMKWPERLEDHRRDADHADPQDHQGRAGGQAQVTEALRIELPQPLDRFDAVMEDGALIRLRRYGQSGRTAADPVSRQRLRHRRLFSVLAASPRGSRGRAARSQEPWAQSVQRLAGAQSQPLRARPSGDLRRRGRPLRREADRRHLPLGVVARRHRADGRPRHGVGRAGAGRPAAHPGRRPLAARRRVRFRDPARQLGHAAPGPVPGSGRARGPVPRNPGHAVLGRGRTRSARPRHPETRRRRVDACLSARARGRHICGETLIPRSGRCCPISNPSPTASP